MSAREPIRRHESAVGHVTGRAVYTDELHPPLGLASLYPVQVPHAHARLRGIDARAALALPGVLAVLTAADVPGENETGTILRDEPLIPADTVQFHGQAVAWVVAEDEALARRAAALVQVDAEPLPACLSIAAAIALGAERSASSQDMLLVSALSALMVAASVAACVWVAYAYAEAIARRIGPQGTLIATKLTAFLLLCIGVQIILTGASDALRPLLAARG